MLTQSFIPVGNKLFQDFFFSGARGVIVEYWDLILLYVCRFPTVTAGRVRSLSTALWSLTHLTALHLSDNSLSRIPPDIAKLHNLVYLDLSSNKIRSLPAELGNMVSLRWVISSCTFTSFLQALWHGVAVFTCIGLEFDFATYIGAIHYGNMSFQLVLDQLDICHFFLGFYNFSNLLECLNFI